MPDRVAGKAATLASTEVIKQLRDIEEIRLLKHRYMRCLDLKLWDEIGETLTVDATFGTGTSVFGKPMEIRGRTEIVAFFRASLGAAVLTEHTATQPEITVDGDTATGVWAHRETVLSTGHRMIVAGTGFCEDHYERGGDVRWRIARIVYARNYEVIMSLDDLPSFQLITAPSSHRPESTQAGEFPTGSWGAAVADGAPGENVADTRRR
jgi:hypothetical protein